jgi:cytochrome-b5 reductase
MRHQGKIKYTRKKIITIATNFPSCNPQILRCGPPPMNKAMAAHLEALGYAPEMLFQF